MNSHNDRGLDTPNSIDTERSLLGAILTNNCAYEVVSEYLRPEHFVMPVHARIYEVASRLIETGILADAITLKRHLEDDEALIETGGLDYLDEITDFAIDIASASEFGEIIYSLNLRRKLIAFGWAIIRRANDINLDVDTQFGVAEQHLYDLAITSNHEGGFQYFKDSVCEAIDFAETAHKRAADRHGVNTGSHDLDQLLGRLHAPEFLILAGRLATGKTALATNIAYNAAYSFMRTDGKAGAVVGYFSLEMSGEQLTTRILSDHSKLSSSRIRKGELNDDEFSRLVMASQNLHQIPMFIDESPARNVSELRIRARRLKHQHNLGLIVIDYLQLIAGRNASGVDDHLTDFSEITRGLKALAKELDVAVLLLVELPSGGDGRNSVRPSVDELDAVGDVRSIADTIMMLFREEQYHQLNRPIRSLDQTETEYIGQMQRWEECLRNTAGLVDVTVVKNRTDQLGAITIKFD